ncbi:MAG: phage late control D family protein [Archangiaceae bacterium]|nr:phage late control D family protein [Archangiaceae bacterium]
MSPSDRSAPGVRITSLADERAASGAPLNLDGRVLAFSYEDSALKADQASLRLDNSDLSLFDRPEFAGGAVLEVSWGYPGQMSLPRRVVVRKLKGFQTLTVEGQATSVLMNLQAKTRSWSGKRRSDVVRELAAEYGFIGEAADIGDTSEVLEAVHQSSETDARFLRRLAAREEFEFFVDDSGFHWRARNQAPAPTRVLTWYSDPGRGEVMSVNVESDLVRRVGRVDVKGRDPLAKAPIAGSANSETVPRSTLGELVEVVDPETGSTSLQQRNATVSAHPTTATTPEAAKREAEARFRAAERDTVKLSLQVVGDPTLRAKTIIEVRGISKALSGKYYLAEAKHVINASGYVVDLKLTRDGLGSTEKAVRPQGGQPNRGAPTPGGSLKSIEVVDPERGDTRVDFRRGDSVIGAEDPETGMSVPR